MFDKGKFYGTTVGGGTGAGCNYCGTVYSITKTGVEKVLYSFQGGNDGNDPQGPLYATGGKLYGTTTTGGGTGCSAAPAAERSSESKSNALYVPEGVKSIHALGAYVTCPDRETPGLGSIVY